MSQRDYDRIGQLIDDIKRDFAKPGWRPLTSLQMRDKADERRHIATWAKLNGAEVRPEYEPIDLSERYEDEL